MESYSEPAVLWRLQRGSDEARAMVIPGAPTSTLVFFLNNELDRGENYDEWDVALMRAEDVRRDLMEQGWRPTEGTG